jgi:hypothetical protein
VVRRRIAFDEPGKRPAFGLQVDDDLLACFQDEGGIGPRTGHQSIVGRIAPLCVAGKGDVTKGEGRAGLDGDCHRNGAAVVEFGVGRQGIEILAGDRHIHNAAITRLLIKRREDAVAVVAGLDDKAEIAGHRLALVLFQARGVLDRVLEVVIIRSGIERQRVVHGIDDGGGRLLIVLEEFHAENFEGRGWPGRQGAAQQGGRNRKRGASSQKRKTLFRPVHFIPHPQLSVAFLLQVRCARQTDSFRHKLQAPRLIRSFQAGKDPNALGFP